VSAREQCQGDLFATASSALRAAPPVADRVLLSDLIDAATLLSLGDDSGFGKNTLYRLRAEIAAASRELVRRWTEAQS
jgi:hypothetical protein